MLMMRGTLRLIRTCQVMRFKTDQLIAANRLVAYRVDGGLVIRGLREQHGRRNDRRRADGARRQVIVVGS